MDQVCEFIDKDASTWNKVAGIVQLGGEPVRYSKGPDILTVTVRGEEIMRLR